MLSYLHICSEFFSLVFALIYYATIKKTVLKWFIPFLAFILAGEIYGKYVGEVLHIVPNYDIYFLIGAVEIVFYGGIFFHLSKAVFLHRMINLLVLIGVAVFLITFIYYRQHLNAIYYSVNFAGFLLVAISLGYLYSRFTAEDAYIMKRDPGFWIALGLCLFFCGVSVTFSFHETILRHNITVYGQSLHNFVPQVLCVVLYASISTAIILCKQTVKV